MAEANLLISLRITPDGFNIEYNTTLMNLLRSVLRSWKRRYGRLKNRLVNNVYPLSYRSLIICLMVSALIGFFRIPKLHYLHWKIGEGWGRCLHKVYMGRLATRNEFYIVFTNALIYWVMNIFFFKYSLWALLQYQGWVFDEPRNITLKTKVWMLVLKYFVGSKRLKSFQSALPRLPLPSLRDTVDKYLSSAECIYDPEEMGQLRDLADDFRRRLGPKLQGYLWFKSWSSSNFVPPSSTQVSDWWEEYIYLCDRSSIVINSNYYSLGMLGHSEITSTRQTSRAAGVVYSLLQVRRAINTENLEPPMALGSVPLCTSQYDRLFNTSRIAHSPRDKLVHFDVSNHISVYYRKKYYKVYIYCNSRLASPSELERVFDAILSDDSDGDDLVGVITAIDRDTSASLRGNYFSSGTNKESIEAIDKAAFHLVFEDSPANLDMTSTDEHLSDLSRKVYIGRGFDRWYEKSFNLIVFSDGHVSSIAEHSWGDALVMAHMHEDGCLIEMSDIKYAADGRIVPPAEPRCRLLDPIRLRFEIDDNLKQMLQNHVERIFGEINNIDLCVFRFNSFGKNFGRTNGLSTDSLIQLALQLAYYKETGSFVHTYESASTRFFLEGRTETIRSCTQESCRFVKALIDEELNGDELKVLAKEAISSHQRISRLAATGNGIDRHMFCLFVISKFLHERSPFLEKVLQEKWGISSSQTPVAQMSNKDFNTIAMRATGGGFGPTCFRGYGVAYFPNEDIITFHITCLKDAEGRDAGNFRYRIEESLQDIARIISR